MFLSPIKLPDPEFPFLSCVSSTPFSKTPIPSLCFPPLLNPLLSQFCACPQSGSVCRYCLCTNRQAITIRTLSADVFFSNSQRHFPCFWVPDSTRHPLVVLSFPKPAQCPNLMISFLS